MQSINIVTLPGDAETEYILKVMYHYMVAFLTKDVNIHGV